MQKLSQAEIQEKLKILNLTAESGWQIKNHKLHKEFYSGIFIYEQSSPNRRKTKSSSRMV